MPDRYVLVTRAGVDTLHRNPREECNLDDTDADQTVDEATAMALLDGIGNGDVKTCGHCGTSS